MAIDVDKIYNKIRERIINLTLVPDSLVKEETLCADFKVSRTPIRSVITRLVQDGLLVVKPKKGTYVSKISYNGIQNDTFLRKAVESLVIEDCCKVIKEEDLKVLKDILNEQETICKLEPSIQKSQLFNENDNKFHHTIFTIAGHESLWFDVIKSTINFDRVRVMSNFRTKEDVMVTYKYHCEIFKYISENNVQKAVEVFQAHLNLAFDKFENIVEQYKEYFDKELMNE